MWVIWFKEMWSSGAREMGSVGKPDDLSSIPESYTVERRIHSWKLSSDLHMCPTRINNNNYCFGSINSRDRELLSCLFSGVLANRFQVLCCFDCVVDGEATKLARFLASKCRKQSTGRANGGESNSGITWLPGSSINKAPSLRASLAGIGQHSET